MPIIQHPNESRTQAPCCTPDAAWCHVREMSWLALRGNVGAHVVAGAVDHALRMGQAVP